MNLVSQLVGRLQRCRVNVHSERQQRRQKLLSVADDDDVRRDALQSRLDPILDGNRGHVFTPGCDQLERKDFSLHSQSAHLILSI